MGYDIFQSRRTYNEPCKWWKRDERDNFDGSELVYKRNPNGYFYAKELTAETSQDNMVGGVFKFERSTITIKTPDNILDMSRDDFVEYDGELWLVVNVQKRKSKIARSEFASDSGCSHFYFIELRK